MLQLSVEFVVTDRPPDQQFDIQALRRFDLEKPDILYSLSQRTVITHNKAFLWNWLMLDQIWTCVGYVQGAEVVRRHEGPQPKSLDLDESYKYKP